MKTVLFIGLGAMGGPMASNILKADYPLQVFDILDEKILPLVKIGGVAANNVFNASKDADIVITMLPATQQVVDVITGPEGILSGMRPGGIVVDMSTISPSGTDLVARECQKKSIEFIDAPVGRQVVHAVKGESLFMVGCDSEDAFDKVKPYFETMGTTIIRCGKVGSGIRMKLVNNMQIITIAEVTAEAILLSEKFGLDLSLVKEVNAGTTANNGQMQFTFPNKSFKGDIEPGFTIRLAHKDIALAMESARGLGISLPTCATAEKVYGSAKSGHFGEKDFSALLNYWCEREHIEVPGLKEQKKS